ncbi:MAG TPA: hypothetical protein VJ952_05300 [Opitutales bacterium]|nr:hypothetical protein [Opitutales bacterium]
MFTPKKEVRIKDHGMLKRNFCLFLVSCSLTAGLAVETYSRKEVVQMARESADLIIKDYQEHGIEAGIMAADYEYAKQRKIERKHADYDFRIANTEPAIYELELLLWAEAQRGGGRLDKDWALALFKWIHAKNVERHSNKFEEPAYYGPLVSNIFYAMHAVGRRGEAHKLTLEMERSLREIGIEARTRKLPELAPWNEGFPEIKMRQFPLKSDDKSSTLYKDGYFNFVYFQALLNIANQAYLEGDWQRAAELYLWIRVYTQNGIENKMTTYSHAMNEWRDQFSAAGVGLSLILLSHDQDELAIKVLDDIIEKGYKAYLGRNLDEARVLRAFVLSKLDRCDGETIDQALIDFNRLSKNGLISPDKFAVSAARMAMVLHLDGRTEEAWEILRSTQSRLGEYARNALMHIKLAEIRLMQREERFDELKVRLHAAIEAQRNLGLKLYEPELYEIYAEVMMHENDHLAAIHAQTEAARIYYCMDREASLGKAVNSILSYISSYTKNLNENDRGLSEVLLKANVSLQPVRSVTVSPLNQTAHGSFYLTNPNPKKVSGKLKLKGRCSEVVMAKNGKTLLVTVHPAEQNREVVQDIELKALSKVQIQLKAVEIEKEDQLHLMWEDEQGHSQSALWHYMFGREREKKAFANPVRLRNGPYFQIPVHHSLQRPEFFLEKQFSNIRVFASEVCRIELYDQSSGKLISVDANGNGAFDDPGDLIIADTSQDGLPDIGWESGDSYKNLKYYYSLPPEKKPSRTRSITFEIQTQHDKRWVTEARDIVKK